MTSSLTGTTDIPDTITRGTTVSFTVNTNPITNITGGILVFTIDTDVDPSTAPALTFDITPTDPLYGKSISELTPTQTLALSAGTYYWSIRLLLNTKAYVLSSGTTVLQDGVSERIN